MNKDGLYKAQYAAALQDEEKGQIIRDLEDALSAKDDEIADKDDEIADLESKVSNLNDEVGELKDVLDAIACDAKNAI